MSDSTTIKLKYIAVLFFIFFLVSSGMCQRIHENGFLIYVDQPRDFNKELIKKNYHSKSIYTCSDSILNKNLCPCTRREYYNDSGRIIKRILGNDIDKGNINYSINYQFLNDSIGIVVTEYKAHFIDSTSDFMLDTSINKRFRKIDIYKRSLNRDLIIKSVMIFKTENDLDLPDTIFRYDISGQLKEIYYPQGNRKALKEWNDTVINSDSKKISYHFIYKENEFHSYVVYSPKSLILEDGSLNRSFDNASHPVFSKCIHVYDDSLRLILRHNLNESNQFVSDEHFTYQNGRLLKYVLKYSLTDSLENAVRIYDSLGHLILDRGQSSSYPYDMWQYKYSFNENLEERMLYFMADKLKFAEFYIYQ